MQLSKQEIEQFQEKILTWYAQNQRDLPWRSTRDPYRILISEVMSQQTQIQRVIPKYEAWLEVFPSVKELARASVTDVLRMWSGLGYNRRALNLQKAAKEIVTNYKSLFPQKPQELQTLPGIGSYTAAAVACFAFDRQIPVIDTNIRKVIAVSFFKGEVPSEKILAKVALQLLPHGKAYTWNQALMDYSSLVLKEKKILIPKQSHFRSSNRYFRGKIITLLLANQQITFDELWQYFQEDNPIDNTRLVGIISSMKKEGLIQSKKELIFLAEL
jgi:A/G-specific adenine glycosylase